MIVASQIRDRKILAHLFPQRHDRQATSTRHADDILIWVAFLTCRSTVKFAMQARIADAKNVNVLR
ncbi:hypothetical protein EB837_02340 [Kluyvera ascorbata]|jgi:hypothetical protein|uniref:Uncharacterized protein n=1 Tax=Kluyvera ascorbata TaxID=51288 RepID=A0A3N2SDL6_9ENTR|nr:hypothetical protein EB837_02340 [Kluyvera ascorbata]